MTTQTPDTQAPEDISLTQPVAPQGNDSRRRLRELLAIAERDRTDEQWDEIIELEIQLAPGNRASVGEHGGGPVSSSGGQNKPLGQPKKHRPRSNSNNNNRRPRSNKPTGNPV